MTKRRLINKKAYDELVLLQELLKSDNENEYVVNIQVNDNGEEGFVMYHSVDGDLKSMIVGENYTVISKMIINYLSKLQ